MRRPVVNSSLVIIGLVLLLILILSILTFFNGVFAPTLASLITAVATLTAVKLTNDSNTKNQQDKLNSELLDKAIERKFNLRSNLYLEAGEKTVEMHSAFPKLFEEDGMEAFQTKQSSFYTALNKIELICDQETAKLIQKVLFGYTQLFIEALPMKSKLDEMCKNINSLDDDMIFVDAKNEAIKNLLAKLAELQPLFIQMKNCIRNELGLDDLDKETLNEFQINLDNIIGSYDTMINKIKQDL